MKHSNPFVCGISNADCRCHLCVFESGTRVMKSTSDELPPKYPRNESNLFRYLFLSLRTSSRSTQSPTHVWSLLDCVLYTSITNISNVRTAKQAVSTREQRQSQQWHQQLLALTRCPLCLRAFLPFKQRRWCCPNTGMRERVSVCACDNAFIMRERTPSHNSNTSPHTHRHSHTHAQAPYTHSFKDGSEHAQGRTHCHPHILCALCVAVVVFETDIHLLAVCIPCKHTFTWYVLSLWWSGLGVNYY